VREVVTELFEVFFAQNLRLLAIRTAGHLEDDFITFRYLFSLSCAGGVLSSSDAPI
jgi:hypothetical protein